MGKLAIETFSDTFIVDKVIGCVQFDVKISKNVGTTRCLAVMFSPEGHIVQIESFFYKGEINYEFARNWLLKGLEILRADEEHRPRVFPETVKYANEDGAV